VSDAAAIAEAVQFGAYARAIVTSDEPLEHRLAKAVMLTALLPYVEGPIEAVRLAWPFLGELVREGLSQ
jgi:hypothetical protein